MSKDRDGVGYCRPPASTKFKAGKSGNPKGRPKGTRNLKSDLADVLSEKVMVTEGGGQQRMSKQRALIKRLMAKAVQGDGRAADTVLKLIDKLMTDDASGQATEPLSSDDQSILDQYFARRLAIGDK